MATSAASGTIVNPSATTISGGSYGVEISGAPASVTNASGGVITASGQGVAFQAGGYVTNASGGTIVGGSGVYGLGGVVAVVNAGDIAGDTSCGILLQAGGSVTNQSGGTISGSVTGVYVNNATGTVVNAGSITDAYEYAIQLQSGGYVANLSTGTISATLEGVYITGGTGTVVNSGDIAATGTGTAGVHYAGVNLTDGGTVSNTATGTISANRYGVTAGNAAATLINAGIVSGGTRYAVGFSAGGYIWNASGGTIVSDTNAVGVQGSAGTVVNAGTILSPGNQAVYLLAGGSVTNAATGVISAGFNGINFSVNDAGTLFNAGLISGGGQALLLQGGGYVSNSSTGTLTGGHGILVDNPRAATIVNAGLIAGGYSDAVQFAANETNRLIVDPGASFSGTVDGGNGVASSYASTLELASGASAGKLTGLGTQFIDFTQTTIDTGAHWTLTAANTLSAGYTLTNAGVLVDSGTLTNDGYLAGSGTILLVGTGTIVGTGGIAPTETIVQAYGTSIAGAGSVTNAVSTTLLGGSGGVYIGGLGTIDNSGTLTGLYNVGATLAAGGYVSNAATGTISGLNYGLRISGGTGSLVNAGKIAGTVQNGVDFLAGGQLSNASGGTISSGIIAIYANGSGITAINAGNIDGTAAYGIRWEAGGYLGNETSGTIFGSRIDIFGQGGTGTVVNAGTIGGNQGYGVLLAAGYVGNALAGTIASGQNAVDIQFSAGTVINAGYIHSTNAHGVAFQTGGTLTNQLGGTIVGDTTGIDIAGGAGTVINAGTIEGTTQYGVDLEAGGYVSNASGGTIVAPTAGIIVSSAAGTVVNAGSIVGGTGDAVRLSAGFANRLIIDPGASLTGISDGGNTIGATAVSTLELASGASAGALASLSTQFVDFAQVSVDAGAQWTFDSTDTVAAGVTLTNAGTLTGPVTLAAGAYLTNTGTGTIVSAGTAVFASGIGNAVVNYGSIGGSEAGLYLSGGATATNAASGTISGTNYGVTISGGAGTLTNAGSIIGSVDAVLLAPGFNDSLVLDPGAVFVGKVDGGNTIGATATSKLELASAATAGTLTSLGSQYVHFAYVSIDAGAQWTLASDTLGSAYMIADAGTLTNTGTLGSAVALGTGAALTNSSTGTISSGSVAATVYGTSTGTATVTNAGHIGNSNSAGSGAGIDLAGGGLVTNKAGGTISSVGSGIKTGGPGYSTVVNGGVILATNLFAPAVDLYQGGTLTNLSGGSIVGVYSAVRASTHSFLNVVNDGLLQGTGGGWAIGSGDGASITNQSSGTITASYFGITIDGLTHNGPSTLVNSGLVLGGTTHGSAVNFGRGGFVTNLASGTLAGYVGVSGGGGMTGFTVVNAGTITGSYAAVSIGGTLANRVVFDPGAVFSGYVTGGHAVGDTVTSTLELASGASAGTLSGYGVGLQFANFAQTTVDAGASWTLTGTNDFIAGTTIQNAGTLTVFNTTLNDGGVVINNGTLIVDPATLTVAALTGTGNTVIDANSTLAVTGTVSAGETITFAGNSGELIVDPTQFAGTIHAFQAGTTIDLTGVSDLGTASIVNGNTLEIQRTSNPAIDLTLDTGYSFAGVNFTTTSGGIVTTDNNPCFCPGTLIRTDKGEVAVEDLQVGDRVVTASGAIRPIRWIGYRHMDLTRHPSPHQVQPIRVRAGAFAPNEPARDLFLSPEHAVFRDDLLIPVRLLVNGASIQREARRAVTYFHIELETHDILLAENLRVESYLDTGNRGMFENAEAPLLLHPDLTNDQARRICESAAPFADDPASVRPIWQSLANRAEAVGLALPHAQDTTNHPKLRVEVDGRSFRPVAADGDRYIFMLPAWKGPLTLRSRHTAPNESQPWLVDQRKLGVMVREMTLSVGEDRWPVSVDNPALGAGWWDVERDGGSMWRWTNGDAKIGMTSDKRCRLDVRLCDTLPYPTAAVSEPEIGSLAA